MHFGRTLRVLRTSAGVSLRELARRIGLSAAYLSNVERGLAPPPTEQRIRQLEKALGVPSGDLLCASGRVDGALGDYLAETPEACDFLRLARTVGLTGPVFGRLTAVLHDGGARGFEARLAVLDRAAAVASLAEAAALPLLDGQAYLTTALRPEHIVTMRGVRDRADLFRRLVALAAAAIPELDGSALHDSLVAREGDAGTSLGDGVAVPHGTVAGLSTTSLFLVRLPDGVDYGAVDGRPVHLCFFAVTPAVRDGRHLKLLARIAQLCSHPAVCRRIREAPDAAAVLAVISETMQSIP